MIVCYIDVNSSIKFRKSSTIGDEQMQWNELKVGLRVKVTHLDATTQINAEQPYLDARREGATGQLLGVVARRDIDNWLVQHDDGKTGAYSYKELEKAA